MRYDVAIIGAGVDGLSAAALLAQAGLTTVLVEAKDHPGGLAETTEFHPGFRASRWVDEIAPIPAPLYWQLDLARRGAIFVPSTVSCAVWPDRKSGFSHSSASPAAALLKTATCLAEQAVAQARATQLRAHAVSQLFCLRGVLGRGPETWPGSQWAELSLHELGSRSVTDADDAAHLAAISLAGRAFDPFLQGSAVQLLAPGSGGSGIIMGGMGKLAAALVQAARQNNAEIRCGLDAAEFKFEGSRVAGLVLADGSEVEARAVISTLDAKRTFLFAWPHLPPDLRGKANTFRTRGSMARILVALERGPEDAVGALACGPIHVAPGMEHLAQAHMAWRSDMLAVELPIMLRFSAGDCDLAPEGAAVMTITVGCVPLRLIDGPWTKERRDMLRDRSLAAVESVLPGTMARVIATHVITPSDVEDTLGATGGDVWGGEIAPDQMFASRPWHGFGGARTPVKGLYLAGPSSSCGILASGASGAFAADAVLTDFRLAPST